MSTPVDKVGRLLYHKNRVIGVTGVDFSMDAMRDLVLKIKPYTTGYGFLISETGIMVAHPKKNLVGENVRKFVFQTTFDRITL